MDAGLKRELERKVYAGERLTRADGEALYASDDLTWLGRLAHHRRAERHSDLATFTFDAHLNLTNICGASCAFCGFRRGIDDKDAYTMRVEDVAALVRRLDGEQLSELHIVNGLHPDLPWRHHLGMLRELKAALPGTGLTAFTATEIWWFEKTSGESAGEILDELMDAGLDSLAGGGAEIFDREIRRQLVDHSCHWEDWSRIHRLAHTRGMKTPATMLYGHLELPRHRVDHVLRLRDLQDETGGIQAFVPLRYQRDVPDRANGGIRNRLSARTTMAAPADALKTFAVSRLLLDNVPHVTCLRPVHGRSVAQLSLNFGADDVDDPVAGYTITHDPDGLDTPRPEHREDLLNLIRDAGFRPVERDARHEVVRAYDPAPSLAERRAEPQRIWA